MIYFENISIITLALLVTIAITLYIHVIIPIIWLSWQLNM